MMGGGKCGKGKHRKHTPIVSKAQMEFFGVEYAKKKKGKKGRTDMSLSELKRHIKEAKGKDLPRRKKKR